MQMITKTILAICCVGAVAVAMLTPADARCPQGWTVQGGRCQPYRWGGSGYAWQRPGWNNNWGPGWNNNWAVAGIPGMDADPVTRYRADDARRIDGEGEAGGGKRGSWWAAARLLRGTGKPRWA